MRALFASPLQTLSIRPSITVNPSILMLRKVWCKKVIISTHRDIANTASAIRHNKRHVLRKVCIESRHLYSDIKIKTVHNTRAKERLFIVYMSRKKLHAN